jgi:hypothetical protein
MGSAREQSVKSWSPAAVNAHVLQRVARQLCDKARAQDQMAVAIRAEQCAAAAPFVRRAGRERRQR